MTTEDRRVEEILHDISVLIRSLEGLPVEFRMAKILSKLLRTIGPRIAGPEDDRYAIDDDSWSGGFAPNH